MAGLSLLNKEDGCMDLPPGFRFHPTDEEIITNYLSVKVVTPGFTSRAIGEVDLNKCEPWELPSKAKMGEKEWYFFCHKDRKYPTGMRANRATEVGYWKATGKDKEIYRGKDNLVGMKKTLVFYKGRAPKGEKTNWVIHEFRLEGAAKHEQQYYDLIPRSTNKDEWVVCKVFHKTNGAAKRDAWAGKDEACTVKDQGHNISMCSTDQQMTVLPAYYSNINQQESSSMFMPQIQMENPYNMGYLENDQYSMFNDSSSSFKAFTELRNDQNNESNSSVFLEQGMCGFQSFAEFGGTSSAGIDFNVQWKY